ncbi:CRISPR-associated endoribonuclease Cas6 [Polymorphospora rubra]|uniref:CRISPR-associated endoribonuclease Cas6 n=1 Tax=Polymorphospora rubra TaxID=338584 RepID=UPI003404A4F1
MRLRLEIVTAAKELPWERVLAPGRALAYNLLAETVPELGRQLHQAGWGVNRMVPFGHSAPVFAAAPRQRGRYAAGGPGVVEFGSPVPEVVAGFARALRKRELLDWGGVAFRLTRVSAVAPPEFADGTARFRTATPVVMKGSGRTPTGERTTRQAWLLPGDDEYPTYLAQNLQRKLETLDLPGKALLEAVTWVGPKRSFAVGGGLKPGAPIEVQLRGDPEALQAIWSWGLGQANSAGFGWIITAR